MVHQSSLNGLRALPVTQLSAPTSNWVAVTQLPVREQAEWHVELYKDRIWLADGEVPCPCIEDALDSHLVTPAPPQLETKQTCTASKQKGCLDRF